MLGPALGEIDGIAKKRKYGVEEAEKKTEPAAKRFRYRSAHEKDIKRCLIELE